MGCPYKELVSPNMSHIQLAWNTIIVLCENGATRSVFLTVKDTQQLYKILFD
jgi:hypothetical protein